MYKTQFGMSRWGKGLAAMLALFSLGQVAEAQVVAQVPVPPGQGKLMPAAPMLGDVFGSSLDVDGDFLVTGGLGAAWVYENIGGLWVQQARLIAPNASLNFGVAVAIDGDRILVGDTGDDGVPVTAHVFVFERGPMGWDLEAQLPDANGKSAFDSFGSSLELHGDTVIAGSKHVGGNIGAAFIYHFDGVQWNEQAALLAPNPRPGAVFGTAVSVFGDRVAIGAPGDPLEQVVIYSRVGANWGPTRVLSDADTGGNATPNSGFGSSVSLGPSTIVVGLPTNSIMGPSSGSVAIFEDGPGGFQFDDACTASDVAPNNQFGGSVSFDGNRLLVGSPFDGVAGSAYLFTRDPLGLIEDAKFTPADGQPGDRFGASVALSNNTVAFGAPFNAEGGSWVGAVYTLTQMVTPVLSETFCYGDGGDQAGCTNCPCGNNSPVGTVGGCLNSTGTSAQLSVMGQASVAADTLRLEVVRANPSTFGLLFSGSSILPNSGTNPCPGGAGVPSIALDGLRCVGVSLRRHGIRATDASGDIGVSNPGWGLPDNPAAGLVSQGGFAAGQTRFFQVNYREDALLGCGTGLTTTNGVATVIVP